MAEDAGSSPVVHVGAGSVTLVLPERVVAVKPFGSYILFVFNRLGGTPAGYVARVGTSLPILATATDDLGLDPLLDQRRTGRLVRSLKVSSL